MALEGIRLQNLRDTETRTINKQRSRSSQEKQYNNACRNIPKSISCFRSSCRYDASARALYCKTDRHSHIEEQPPKHREHDPLQSVRNDLRLQPAAKQPNEPVRGDDRLMPKALKREPDPRELRTLLLAARGDWGTFWRMWMLILVYRLAVPSVAIAVWLGLAGLF